MKTEINEDKTKKNIISHQTLFNIIDFLPDPIVVIDKAGSVIIWNKATEELTGVRPADVIGQGKYATGLAFYGERRPVLVDLVLEPDIILEKKYPKLERKGEIMTGENFTPTTRGGQGNYSWGKAAPLRDDDGNIVGAIQTVRDVTEKKQQEDLLKKKITELEKMDSLAIERELRMAELKKIIKGLEEKLEEKAAG